MNSTTENDLIYLKVPYKWKETYINLLYLLDAIGKDLIITCTCDCSDKCNEAFKCWNIFQSALAAEELDDDKKGTLLIEYINGQLDILYKNYNLDKPNIEYIDENIYYGSSSISDYNNLELNTLSNNKKYNILNDELTIETTDDKPIIWFVSTIPLRFKQASIICDMTEHKKDDYYYYNTDELVAGDNKYFIFKKE